MKKFSLFLDRDGVINKRIVDGYVRNQEEFVFLDGVLNVMPLLARKFDYCFVVTNQQGIAKGLMTENDLKTVHDKMMEEIEKVNGRIDRVYYCPEHHSTNPHCRKPNPGMALQAVEDFPEVDFEYAVMVGDSISDIEFGHRLNMKTVFIETKKDIDKDKLAEIKNKIDFSFASLKDFALHSDKIIA
jgi:D-glycero-D-manno-heptose 1,7-bisphosphate phosphatase